MGKETLAGNHMKTADMVTCTLFTANAELFGVQGSTWPVVQGSTWAVALTA